ncbi:unnamed protein product [Choristocarpus tenellus]
MTRKREDARVRGEDVALLEKEKEEEEKEEIVRAEMATRPVKEKRGRWVHHNDRSMVGFLNPRGANRCYVNAILQAFFSSGDLMDVILNEGLMKAMKQTHQEDATAYRILKELAMAVCGGVVRPLNSFTLLKKFPQFEPNRVQDAVEFLEAMVRLVEAETEGKIGGGRLLGQLNIQIRKIIWCNGCQARSGPHSLDDFILRLSPQACAAEGSAPPPLESLIREYTKEEDMGDCTCAQCGSQRSCKIYITKVPKVLFIQINRFVCTKETERTKALRHKVAIPQQLDLAPLIESIEGVLSSPQEREVSLTSPFVVV